MKTKAKSEKLINPVMVYQFVKPDFNTPRNASTIDPTTPTTTTTTRVFN